MLSFSSAQFSSPSLDANDSESLYTTAVTTDLNEVYDLTTIIRSKPSVTVTGIGAIAKVRLLKQNCEPLYFLNGVLIHDYHTLYYLANSEKIEKVKIIQPRQAALYGLVSSSGIIEVTTE